MAAGPAGSNSKPVLTINVQKELEKLRGQGQREIQALNLELRLKEKALAEAVAFVDAAIKVGGLLLGGHERLARAAHRRKAIEWINEMTWTPKTEPVLMRASQEARLGQEKPHEAQVPHTRTDLLQAAHR